jgi:class 3 adenylate cyclase/CHASE2 domain-containing sensor protein
MQKKLRSPMIIALLCAAIALASIIASQSEFLARVEGKMVDARFDWRYSLLYGGQGRVSDEVVLAGVDEKSVDPSTSENADRWGSGGWMTRDHWIRPLALFALEFKPKIVGYDILFRPYRSSRSDEPGFDDSSAVDQYLSQKKLKFNEAILDENFPRLPLLNLLDEACSANFGNKVRDLNEMRALDHSIPEFITAYNLTSKADGANPWNVADEDDKEKIETIGRNKLPEGSIMNPQVYRCEFDNASLPFVDLLNAVRLGCINVPRDSDGNIRRVPLVLGFEDPLQENKKIFVPSLSLQSVMLYLGINPDYPEENTGIKVTFGKEIHLWAKGRELHIPVDTQGRLFLNFQGKIKDFIQVPYIALLDSGGVLQRERKGTLDKKADMKKLVRAHKVRKDLQGKIVLTGVTFTGASDVGPCAIDTNTPLVFIHMTAIDNMLRRSFMKVLNGWQTAILICFLVAAVGGISATTNGSFAGASVMGIFALLWLAAFLLYEGMWCVPIVVPSLSVLVTFGVISSYRFAVEQKGRLEIRKMFSTMVSPKVLRYLEDHPDSFSLKGEKRETTMFFSDVAKFTSISERLPPEQLSQILNEYLTPMTDLILHRDGYLNKYAGDGIMAVWGALNPQADHALQACLSAIEQQEKIKELVPLFKEKYDVKLHVRMGLNSGLVSAGMMGSQKKKEYTVMGDAVNFAARLEPANKDYGTLIVVGENTYQLVKEHLVFRLLDRIIVEGKTKPIAIYELIGKREEVSEIQLESINLFEEGLKLYWKRDWAEAKKTFRAVLKRLPEDVPSQTFISRVQEYEENPPPKNWAGEYVRLSKN